MACKSHFLSLGIKAPSFPGAHFGGAREGLMWSKAFLLPWRQKRPLGSAVAWAAAATAAAITVLVMANGPRRIGEEEEGDAEMN